ncbi:galactose mutarotase-like domain-containing protein [Polychytrium aggregatum]|uniref:galactose mutarotase-like domain-containing protein n=1 Tax=Polychytrium aggregatum TaxID=110093 RepID=UPI0022FDDA83|nr:galactose mutarotase-like domain-containing protein [Polychytrium aggregatum]KAI9207985.1 galactose mutarotase-like domain-containing protein [Polychytrium aggregatum]
MPVNTADPRFVQLSFANSSVTIFYFGATVTSWTVDGHERLFLSSKALLDSSKAIRGGIPLVFPHFGSVSYSKLPQHGFARNSTWKFLGAVKDSSDEVVVQFELRPELVPEHLRALWQHDFRLVYTVRLADRTLTTSLRAENPGSESFLFTSLLHTYLRIANVDDVAVRGFENRQYLDKVTPGTFTETRSEAKIAMEVDRVYQQVDGEVLVENTHIGDVRIHKTNFPDVVLWNPWIEKAQAMADFGDEEYKNMVCVEVGSVSTPIVLEAGQSWEGQQILVV